MKYQLLNRNFLIIFSFIVSQGYLGWIVDATDDRAGKYQMLILAQSWLPTFCHSKDRTSLYSFCQVVGDYERWSIHGLWPFGPENCDAVSLNMNQIVDYKDGLKQAWVDVYDINRNNGREHDRGYKLWKDEWLKHGTCAFDRREKNVQEKYFRLTLSSYKKYNLREILAAKGIIPTKNKAYSWYAIKGALEARTGTDSVKLFCRPNDKGDKQYLAEVRVCFDKNQVPMKCGSARTTQGLCMQSQQIIIPDGKQEQIFNGTPSRPSVIRNDLKNLEDRPQGNTRGYGSKAAPSGADLSKNWRARA